MLARLPARTPWRAFAPRRAEPRASWVVSKSSTVGLVDRSRSGLLERSGVAADRIVRAVQPRELSGGVREGALDERGGLRLQPMGVGQADAVGVADRRGQRGKGLVALRGQRRGPRRAGGAAREPPRAPPPTRARSPPRRGGRGARPVRDPSRRRRHAAGRDL